MGFDHTEEIAPQHTEHHGHMSAVGTVVKEGIVKSGHMSRVVDIVDGSNAVVIAIHGSFGDELGFASFPFLGDAVE